MDGRKQMGKHSDYLCRGIVYCTCGAKMHATVWKVKSGKKHVYRCKADCGMKPIPMELVDKAATDYLEEFRSPEMQLKIAAFLRTTRTTRRTRGRDSRQRGKSRSPRSRRRTTI